MNHDHLKRASLGADSCLGLCSITKGFYLSCQYFKRPKCFRHVSWNSHVKYTWLFLSGVCCRLVCLQEKPLENSPNQAAGQSALQALPWALADRQCDGEQTVPLGKEKHSLRMCRETGPQAGSVCFSLILWIFNTQIATSFCWMEFLN